MKNTPYQEAVGSIIYACQGTRPDISYAIGLGDAIKKTTTIAPSTTQAKYISLTFVTQEAIWLGGSKVKVTVIFYNKGAIDLPVPVHKQLKHNTDKMVGDIMTTALPNPKWWSQKIQQKSVTEWKELGRVEEP